MDERFSRAALVMGQDKIEKLNKSRVAVFGAGGVGGYIIEALARAGVGSIDIIDNDKISISNINRQILALTSTIDMYKADVAMARVLDINPSANVKAYKVFYSPETSSMFDFTKYDYIADAIDFVTGKIELVLQAQKSSTKIISCMGAGNKTDPTRFKVCDIYSTSVCPLARVMRHELKKRGVKELKVVFSTETPSFFTQPECIKQAEDDNQHKVDKINSSETGTRHVPGSVSFVPSVAGFIMAGTIINDLVV